MMKRAIQNPATARAARSIASDSTALRRSADASLADKFNLAALNGGKNPFEVSSDSLLRSSSSATGALKPTAKSAKQVKDVYSLEYLLGGNDAAPPTATKRKTGPNPFDVASAKLM